MVFLSRDKAGREGLYYFGGEKKVVFV